MIQILCGCFLCGLLPSLLKSGYYPLCYGILDNFLSITKNSYSSRPLTRHHSYIFLIRVCDDHSATWHFYNVWSDPLGKSIPDLPLTPANAQLYNAGVKKSLVLVPGTSWISGRTSIYFHPMSGGQVKNSMLVYFSLPRTSYLVTGQVKIWMDLPGGQVKIFRFFYPCNGVVVSRNLSRRKCTAPTGSWTQDLWCANPLRYPSPTAASRSALVLIKLLKL